MPSFAAERDANDPVTLHRIMQGMIGEELKARYAPPKKLSHELFVLMLQLKEQERRDKVAGEASKARPAVARRRSGVYARVQP
jgi:hypothetical protein